MKIRSNPASGKKSKVNELMKRLTWITEYDKDLNDPLVKDYVKEVVDETRATMKAEGIMTMEQNWVLYTLHLLIFHHVYFAAAEKIHSVYRDLTEKFALDTLMSMDKGSYNSIYGVFNIAIKGDLSQFLWMAIDPEEKDESQYDKDTIDFTNEFQAEIQRLINDTDFKLVLGLLRHYYKFFKEDIDHGMTDINTQGAGLPYNIIVQLHKQAYSHTLTKDIVSVLTHFYGQAEVLDIKKIKSIKLLPDSRTPAPYFIRLRKYLTQFELEAVRKLETERGNKFIPKQFIDWGEPILTYKEGRSTFVWESLKMPYSAKEGQWALHCGNSTRSHSRDNIFSLREIVGEKVKICVTVTAERQNDGRFVLRESKGVGNNKPPEKYWDLIVDLWMSKEGNFSNITGDGYWTDNNLHFKDLPSKLKEKIINERPDLFTGLHYAFYTGDALAGVKLVKMNFEANNITELQAGSQLHELIHHFLYKDKPTTLTFTYLSRRRNMNPDDKMFDKDEETFFRNALRTIKVKSISPKDAREHIPFELYEYIMPSETVCIWGNPTSTIEELVGKVSPKVIEGIASNSSYEYSDLFFPLASQQRLSNEYRPKAFEHLRVIDKFTQDRFSDPTTEVLEWLADKHPECLSKTMIRKFPIVKYLDVMSKKYGLIKGKSEHDEEVRHEKIEELFSEWIHNHPTKHNLEITGEIEQEEAKLVLKKYPFLKTNLALQVIADGSPTKVINKLLAEQNPKHKAQLRLRDSKEFLEFQTFELENAFDEIGNKHIEHLKDIVEEGHYEIQDIGMNDKQLINEISSFSGHVYKNDPDLYSKLSDWFEEIEDDSPEWETDEGKKIIACIRSAYYEGYQVGAFDDCYNELIEYYKDEFADFVNFDLKYDAGVFSIAVPVNRLHSLLNRYWMQRDQFDDIISFFIYEYREDLPAKSYSGRDIDTFSWDAAYDRFLDELQQEFGGKK